MDVSVKKLAQLAHMDIPSGEYDSLTQQLSEILAFVAQVNESGAVPAPQLGEHYNILREDVVQNPCTDAEDLRAAFPEREGNYMKITKVIDTDS